MTPTAFRKNPSLVQPEYRPLHKYLDDRYASRVILTFSEIEDLLGAPLPQAARLSADWWLDEGDATRRQAETWRQTQRTALPNLAAGTVTFERLLS